MADLEKTIQINVDTEVKDTGNSDVDRKLNTYARTVETIQNRLATLSKLQRQVLSGAQVNPKAVQELNSEYEGLNKTLDRVRQQQDNLSGANLDDTLKLIDNISRATEQAHELQAQLERSADYAQGLGKMSASAPNPFDSNSVKSSVESSANSLGKLFGEQTLAGLGDILPSGLSSTVSSAVNGLKAGGLAGAGVSVGVSIASYMIKGTLQESDKVAGALGTVLKHGLEKGVQATSDLVKRSVDTIGTAAMTGVRGIASRLTDTIAPSLQRIRALISSIGSTFLSVPFIPRLNNISLGLRGITGKLLALGGVGGLGYLIKKAGDLASSASYTGRAFNTVFSDANDSVHNFVANASSAFGLVEEDAESLASAFGETFASADIADDKIQTMTKNMVGLSGDMASLFGASATEMGKKLQSAIAGSSDALKDLGITMTDAQLEAYRLSQGIQTSYSKMSQADKEILRYNYLLNRTAKAQGNAAKAMMSWQASLRSISSSLRSIGSTIGHNIMTALQPVLQIIAQVLSGIASIVKVLGGKVTFKSVKQASSDMSGLGSATDKASDAMKGLGNNTGKAAKKQKELNKQAKLGLASFDQLNNLTQTKSKNNSGKGSGSGKGGGSVPGGSIQPADYVSSIDWGKNKELENWLNGLKQLLDRKDYRQAGYYIAEGARTALENLQQKLESEKLYDAIDEFNEKWSQLVGGFVGDMPMWEQLGTTVGAALNTISQALQSFADDFTKEGVFKNLGKGIATALNKSIEKVKWYKHGHAWGSLIRTALDTAASFISNFKWADAGKAMKENLLGMLDGIFGDNALGERGTTTIGEGISGLINGGFDYLGELLKNGELATKLGGYLKDTINTAINTLSVNSFSSALQGVLDSITGFFNEVKDIDFTDFADKVALGINNSINHVLGEPGKLEEATKAFVTFIANAVDGTADGLSKIHYTEIGHQIATGISESLTQEKVSSITTNILNLISEAVKGVATLVRAIEWTSIAKGLIDGLNKYIKSGEWTTTTTTIVQAIGSVVRGVTTLLAGIPFPKLAKGIVDAINVAISNQDVKVITSNLLTFIGNAVTGVITGLAGLNWVGVASQIVDSINVAIDDYDSSTIGTALQTLLSKAVDAVTTLNDIKWGDFVQNIIDTLSIALANGDLQKLIDQISILIQNIASAIIKLINSPEGQQLIQSIMQLGLDIWFAKFEVGAALTISKAWTTVKGIFAGCGDVLKEIVKTIWDTWTSVEDFKDKIATWIKDKFTDAWNTTKENVTNFMDGLKDNLTTKLNDIKENAFKIFQNGISTYIIKPVKNIWGKISKSWDALKSNIGDKIGLIVTALKDFGNGVKNHIITPVQHVWTKTKDAWSKFKSKVVSVVNAVKAPFVTFKKVVQDVIDLIIGLPAKVASAVASLNPIEGIANLLSGGGSSSSSSSSSSGSKKPKKKKAPRMMSRAMAVPSLSSWGNEEDTAVNTASLAASNVMRAPMRAPMMAFNASRLSSASSNALSSSSTQLGTSSYSLPSRSAYSTLALETLRANSYKDEQKAIINLSKGIDSLTNEVAALHSALSKINGVYAYQTSSLIMDAQSRQQRTKTAQPTQTTITLSLDGRVLDSHILSTLNNANLRIR